MPGARPTLATGLLALALATALASCRHVQKTPTQRGQGVFLRSCAGCHGPDARGTKPIGFPVPPADLTDPALQTRLDDAALRETIRYGKGRMPAFGAALVPEDVTDLIVFLRTLRPSSP